MRDKLEKIIKAYEELEKKLSDPAVASDIKEFTRLNKEYAHQSDLIAASREYIGALDDIEAAKEMLHDTTDADEKEMLQMDISEKRGQASPARGRYQVHAHPERPQRRQEHHRRDPLRRRWRRGGHLRRRPVQDVSALLRVAWLEDHCARFQPQRGRRL